jgi:hypothetical protein
MPDREIIPDFVIYSHPRIDLDKRTVGIIALRWGEINEEGDVEEFEHRSFVLNYVTCDHCMKSIPEPLRTVALAAVEAHRLRFNN